MVVEACITKPPLSADQRDKAIALCHAAVRNMNLLDDVLALRHRADWYISFISDVIASYCRFHGVSSIASPACLSLFDQPATEMI